MVAIEPNYCHQCGTGLETRAFDGRDRAWCPDCETMRFRNAVPSAGVIVHDDDRVLLIERATPPVGTWALPGGHPEYDEEPAAAAVRELEEETGLRADQSDLSLLTVIHGVHGPRHYNMITYTLDYADTAGELEPNWEASDVAFWPAERALDSPDETREIDRRRIEMVFDV
ncbi:NUDIX domain-containing protein [Halobacteriaceae archaeon GCM10025711]